MIVRCESCAARYRVPTQRVGERGAKLKCPACGDVLLVRPPGVPRFDQAGSAKDLPTEDWVPEAVTDQIPVMGLSEAEPGPEDVPTAIKALFAGTGEMLTVHPPGTVPPVQRAVAPRTPAVTSAPRGALSVTPPPPRPTARPDAFLSRPTDRESVRPPANRAAQGMPPRQAGQPPPRVGSLEWNGTIPPPALREDDRRVGVTAQQEAQRVTLGGGFPTAPAAPNRTGPTGGGVPPRATYGSTPPPPDPTPTYAPPWGATPGGPPPWAGTPGAPPPWQAWGTGAPPPTHPGAPWGAGYPTHPGHPGLTYAPPWGTGVPVGTHPGPPMVTSWQPTWVPAVVLGMERRTLAALLGVVLVVGFVGGCMGVGTSQLASWVGGALGRGADVPTVPVQGTPPAPGPVGRVEVEAPGVVTPATSTGSPTLPDLPTTGGARVKVVRPTPEAPAPARPPFEVNPSDVRDPWADPQ